MSRHRRKPLQGYSGQNGKTESAKTGWRSQWIALATLVVMIIADIGIAAYYNQRIFEFNNSILKLENTNTDLTKNQIHLQEIIANLTQNQTNLQARIYEIENYEPTVSVVIVQPVFIGPTPPIDVFPSSRVSFEYNGTLNLNLTILVSTAHNARLTVVGNSLYISGYNSSQIDIGFNLAGITAHDYQMNFESGSLRTASITVPFLIHYTFSESHILEHQSFEIGMLNFRLEFYDFQTHSTRFSNVFATRFAWNNQTSI